MTFRFNSKKPVEFPAMAPEPAPMAAFDYVAAEKAFLAIYDMQLTATRALVCRKGSGAYRPIKAEDVNAFLRSYLIQTGRVSLFRRDLVDDFTAWLKGRAE